MKSRCALFVATGLALITARAADLRLGIIGLDTSHVTAFTAILNDPTARKPAPSASPPGSTVIELLTDDPAAKNHVSGARVVGAFRGGSPDIESSRSRVDGYAKTLVEKHGVKLYDTIEELCRNVDAVLLESVDGRPHLAQARPVIAAGKPLYIDKPMAASLKDAAEIFRLAREANVPVFSASSLRFATKTLAVRGGAIGTVTNAVTSSPAHLEKTHPDLFWYGIHGVESLFTVMGKGCLSVKRSLTADGKIQVIGTWKNERTGTFREAEGYTGKAQGTQGEMVVGAYDGYAPLVVEIVRFLKTRTAPVAAAETLEILAFMEAADESKRRNGESVTLAEMFRRAGIASPE